MWILYKALFQPLGHFVQRQCQTGVPHKPQSSNSGDARAMLGSESESAFRTSNILRRRLFPRKPRPQHRKHTTVAMKLKRAKVRHRY